MINYCLEYQQDTVKLSKRELKDQKKNGMTVDEQGDNEGDNAEYRAYLCPNAGSNNNLSSNRQRLIFMEIDRNDVYSILDVGKVADMILMVMSANHAEEAQLKIDPDSASGAIDEQGYKALGLLRS